MRPAKTILILLALVLAAVVQLSCSSDRVASNQGGKQAISIAVLGYDNLGQGLVARLAITNVAHITINVGHALLHADSPSGSRRVYDDARNAIEVKNALLGPGSNTLTTVLLPTGTLRWQVRYTVGAVDYPEQKVWSQVFECPLALPKMSQMYRQ